jgi:CheY-like chemotaxis protein
MSGNPKKVVIVDDEEDVVMYLSDLLGDNGYDVSSASDAREGLQLIKDRKPDLVCVDILMPVETGFSLYRKIRTDPDTRGIPVIIISGMSYSDQEAGEHETCNGDIPPPDHYMEKPVKPGPFLEVVRGIIG